MQKFGPLLGIIACVLLILAAVVTPSSCSITPEQRAVIIPLTQAALTLAERADYIPPGSSVVIGEGVAIITNETTKREKVLSLTKLGIAEAVSQGQIKEGDALLVNNLGTALVMLVPADSPVESPVGESLPPPSPPPGG